ncbi:hypothetical protein ACFQ14_03025 [Pseudahrensia aquimaris]|uniref:DNA-binding protein n=1 Tax=Pseudahrensia aquimaris TaxID=744461 RepID=A0ABW3FG63_9HYPH
MIDFTKPDTLLSPKDAQEATGLTAYQLKILYDSNELEHRTIGGRRLTSLTFIENYLRPSLVRPSLVMGSAS